MFAKVPTLVVTGGWNDEYEAIAERLARSGAERVELSGSKHRPQDHPGFESALADFLGSRDSRSSADPGGRAYLGAGCKMPKV